MISAQNQLDITHLGFFGFSFLSKYKYRLNREHTIKTNVLGYDIDLPFIRLTPDGWLTAKVGYRWNGASGPTWDTPSCYRGSCFHDIFYQLFRMGLLPLYYKAGADELLRRFCIEDGMWEWRADIWFWGVDEHGDSSCVPGSQPEPHDDSNGPDHG